MIKTQAKSILVLSLSLLFLQMAYAVNSISVQHKSGIELIKEELSVDDLLKKDRLQIEQQIGVKLSLKERLALKLIQRSVKKAVRKRQGEEAIKRAYAKGDFVLNPGAFFLGLFLLPLGVLIVYVFFKKDKRQARRSAWIGFGAMILLLLLVIGFFFLIIQLILSGF